LSTGQANIANKRCVLMLLAEHFEYSELPFMSLGVTLIDFALDGAGALGLQPWSPW